MNSTEQFLSNDLSESLLLGVPQGVPD